MFALPSVGHFIFFMKVLGFLRGFFKIPLSRCGRRPRPLEPIGWWAPAVRLGTRFSFCENFHLHTMIFLYREKVTLFGRGFRVAVPKSLRQYLSVCGRDFPMQGDVAPKVWNCSKTFMRIPSVGSVLFALPIEGIFIYLS